MTPSPTSGSISRITKSRVLTGKGSPCAFLVVRTGSHVSAQLARPIPIPNTGSQRRRRPRSTPDHRTPAINARSMKMIPSVMTSGFQGSIVRHITGRVAVPFARHQSSVICQVFSGIIWPSVTRALLVSSWNMPIVTPNIEAAVTMDRRTRTPTIIVRTRTPSLRPQTPRVGCSTRAAARPHSGQRASSNPRSGSFRMGWPLRSCPHWRQGRTPSMR